MKPEDGQTCQGDQLNVVNARVKSEPKLGEIWLRLPQPLSPKLGVSLDQVGTVATYLDMS